MSAADVLSAHGIQRAQFVVEAAQFAGLDLASAAAMLEKESSGGRNLWGHDGVPTGGAYVKGSEVTRSAYMAYKRALEQGRAGRQGVGPCQLTYGPFQDQADDMGGCWEPTFNIRVGFRVLQGLIASYGVRDGFRRYNGSGPAAVAYADDMMARRAAWQARLAGSAAPGPDTGATPRVLRSGDTGPAVARLQAWLNANYPAYSKIDLAPQRFGPQTIAVVKEWQRRTPGLVADGVVGPKTWAALLAAGYRP